MSGTVMKFGPQWIRTLTDGAAPASSQNISNNSQSTSTASKNNNNININCPGKYKLAEYRYGREEMLAIYEHDMEAPDEIRKYTDLFIETARMPMAMTQMSEEEVKLSTGKWNSDAVLRNSSKLAAASTATGAIPASSSGGGIGGSSISDRDNRLISERSTLTAAEVLSSSPRGPPGSLSRIPLEQRGLLTSLSSRGHPSSIRNLVGRGPNLYSRSQSHDDESPGEGIGGSGGSAGPGGGFENRFGLSGQPRQPNSLRARFETNRAASGLQSSKPIDIKPGVDGESSNERRSVFDRLPNKYNVDDKLVRKDLNGRPIQSDWRSRDWSGSGNGDNRLPKPPPEERSWRSSRVGGAGTADDWRSANNSNTNSSSSWYVRSDDPRNARSQAPQTQENLNPNYSGKRDTLRRPSAGDKHGDEDDDIVNQPRHRRDSLPEWSIGDPLSGDKVGSFDASGAFREIATTEDGNNQSNSLNNKEKQKQQQQQQQPLQQKRTIQRDQQSQSHDFEHLERAAEIMVDEWTAEEEQHERNSSSPKLLNSKSNYSLKEQHDAQTNMVQNNSEIRPMNQNQSQQQQHQQRPELHQSNSDQTSSLAGNSSAFNSNNQQQKFILLPFNHENSQQWFYRDTQGVIQGPFSESEMFEWYKAGYFVKELLVRRACDELFYPLGDVMKMWERIPFAPIPVNLPLPPPITAQTILQLNAVTKHQIEMAASMNAPSQGRIPQNAFEISHPTVLLHGPMMQQQQQQQVHPVLAAATLNQHASGPQEQQANIRQIIEAATRHQQQLESTLAQQQPRAVPVNVLEQNEMQTQLRQLLAQLKNREGFSNLNAQEQQEVLRQYVAFRALPQGASGLPEQELAMLRQRAQMMPFAPNFLANDQQERLRIQQEIDRRMKEDAEKQHQQRLLIMEQRLKAEEEKQRLMDEVQKQRQRKQNEENEKQKQEADKERILKLSQLKQQQLAKQQEEFRQQMQNQQRIQQQQQQEKEKKQQQQQQVIKLNTIQQQQQQQQQIERAKKAAQAQQVQQERKTAWSTVSKADQEPVSLATLQKLQEEEKEKERERQRQMQQQIQANQQHQQQQQQLQLQRQMTWANAAQKPKVAPIKTLAEIQEEEERLAREKQRKAKVQPVVASSGVWNNAASHLSWKNPPADS